MEKESNNLYQCPECGLHYKDKELAEKCETWCKEHKTCNVEIMKQSEEHKSHQLHDQRGRVSLIGELEDCKKKCEEYLNNWKRERADFLNFKKDELERVGMLVKYAKEDIILNILPILDNIELAEKQLPQKLKDEATIDGSTSSPQVEWTKGFLQIKKQILEFLKKEGIEEIKSVGEKFNPETMETVDEVSGGPTSAESGTVVEELQKGYIMDGKVIRPVKVKVTK